MRLLLIDDHKLLIDGLTTALKNIDSVRNVTVKNCAQSALEHLSEGHIYHLIMLDLHMPSMNGFEFMDKMTEEGFYFPIAILSGSEEPEDFVKLQKYKISGYIPKSSSIEELGNALLDISQNKTYIPEKYAVYFSPNYKIESPAELAKNIGLSARKLEIINCIAKGLSNKEVARELNIETSTVNHHLNEIYRTLNVNKRVECINKLTKLKII